VNEDVEGVFRLCVFGFTVYWVLLRLAMDIWVLEVMQDEVLS
jgi:hypothetical protein